MRVQRNVFYDPRMVIDAVGDKVRGILEAGATIDYLTLVPDGEPTLDANLGSVIQGLKPLGIKIAVISNSSLIDQKDVRADLAGADWVSLKVDSIRPDVWRRVDRPHGSLQLGSILDGLRAFAADYTGELATETMLCGGVNDSPEELRDVAAFLAEIRPATSYITAPIRPPAEEWVRLPNEDVLNQAYQILSGCVERVEVLSGYEGNEFAYTGDAVQDILSITAVHPMRDDAVSQLLERSCAEWSVVQDLIEAEQLVESVYEGHRFYLRRLFRRA